MWPGPPPPQPGPLGQALVHHGGTRISGRSTRQRSCGGAAAIGPAARPRPGAGDLDLRCALIDSAGGTTARRDHEPRSAHPAGALWPLFARSARPGRPGSTPPSGHVRLGGAARVADHGALLVRGRHAQVMRPRSTAEPIADASSRPRRLRRSTALRGAAPDQPVVTRAASSTVLALQGPVLSSMIRPGSAGGTLLGRVTPPPPALLLDALADVGSRLIEGHAAARASRHLASDEVDAVLALATPRRSTTSRGTRAGRSLDARGARPSTVVAMPCLVRRGRRATVTDALEVTARRAGPRDLPVDGVLEPHARGARPASPAAPTPPSPRPRLRARAAPSPTSTLHRSTRRRTSADPLDAGGAGRRRRTVADDFPVPPARRARADLRQQWRSHSAGGAMP